jgi:hypothetical protein
MALTAREFWLLFHLGVSVVYLHAFITGLAEVRLGAQRNRLLAGTAIMAVVAWLTVISGTWFVYPWYRAEPLSESAQLQDYPQYYLEEHHNLAYWHEFGMEWKEHVGWLSPILATAVAFIVIRYGPRLVEAGREQRNLRWMLAVLFTVSFLAAAVSGALGAFINVVAPNTFLDLG